MAPEAVQWLALWGAASGTASIVLNVVDVALRRKWAKDKADRGGNIGWNPPWPPVVPLVYPGAGQAPFPARHEKVVPDAYSGGTVVPATADEEFVDDPVRYPEY